MGKIHHAPKFYVKFTQEKSALLQGMYVYIGSIYGRYSDSNGKACFWICDNYALVNGKLPIHFNDGNGWKLLFVSSAHPCYKWVKTMILDLGYVPKIQKEAFSENQIKNMMKHDRYLKKGSGSRIYTNQINNPLRWNEVTELAHWYGKGNASVVASNIRE